MQPCVERLKSIITKKEGNGAWLLPYRVSVGFLITTSSATLILSLTDFINSRALGYGSGTAVILRGGVDINAGRFPEFVRSYKTSL